MKTTRILHKARYLRDLAEEHGLHGLYFQHVSLCRRRAWLHLMGATHAVRRAVACGGSRIRITEEDQLRRHRSDARSAHSGCSKEP